jgi:hypothetical protein
MIGLSAITASAKKNTSNGSKTTQNQKRPNTPSTLSFPTKKKLKTESRKPKPLKLTVSSNLNQISIQNLPLNPPKNFEDQSTKKPNSENSLSIDPAEPTIHTPKNFEPKCPTPTSNLIPDPTPGFGNFLSQFTEEIGSTGNNSSFNELSESCRYSDYFTGSNICPAPTPPKPPSPSPANLTDSIDNSSLASNENIILDISVSLKEKMIEMSIPCALISKITFVLTDISSNTLEEIRHLTSNMDLLIDKILHSVEFIWETKIVIDENQPFRKIFPV